MRALVTGGGGFLGRYIVKKLVERGNTVFNVSRKHYPELDALGVTSIHGDLRDAAVTEHACEGMDAVFHCAAYPGIWGPKALFRGANLDASLAVIDACRKTGVKKLIYTSSPSVVFDGEDHRNVDESYPYSPRHLTYYSKYKALAEQAVIQAANDPDAPAIVSLRPHLIWGPGDPHLIPRVVQRAKKGQLVIVGDGQNRVDTIFVENAADAHLLACEKLEKNSPLNGKVYFIGQDKPILFWEFIGEILERLDIPPLKKHISEKTAYRIGAALEFFHTVFRLKSEPKMTRFLARQLARDHYYSNAAAKRDFGYTPAISMEDGLNQLIAWLKQGGDMPYR